ncbi:hypothetical protein CBL_09186 [Carabus blaptoides fortunei]
MRAERREGDVGDGRRSYAVIVPVPRCMQLAPVGVRRHFHCSQALIQLLACAARYNMYMRTQLTILLVIVDRIVGVVGCIFGRSTTGLKYGHTNSHWQLPLSPSYSGID